MILRSKNIFLVFFTVLWKDFQFFRLFKALYLLRSLLYLSSHQFLECLVTLVSFIFLLYVLFIFLAKSLTTFFNKEMSNKFDMFKILIKLITSLKSNSSSMLFFWIVLLHMLIISSDIRIVMVKRAWLEERCYSE